jgi:hypothetical protein
MGKENEILSKIQYKTIKEQSRYVNCNAKIVSQIHLKIKFILVPNSS